nr:GNAT family N-acetyltransferase [Nocardioides sp. JQ2195]
MCTWQQVDGKEDLEVGYHILPEYQGCGFATEAAGASLELARRSPVAAWTTWCTAYACSEACTSAQKGVLGQTRKSRR